MSDATDSLAASLDELVARTPLRSAVMLDQAESTSLALIDRLKSANPPECPTLLITDRQTAGRGRPGKRWQSRPGDLTFSLGVERPTVSIGLYPLAVGLAVCTAAAKHGLPHAMLKWPNDIVVMRGGQLIKLCGILVETATPSSLCVGIGLNVAAGLTERSRTSLCDETGRSVDRVALLRDIVREVLAIEEQDADEVIERINNRNALKGRAVDSEQHGSAIAGAIDPAGGLELADGSLTLRATSGSIRLADQ